jgi:trimethylguanosine synthase
MRFEVTVEPLPVWLEHERLLGPGFAIEPLEPGWVRASGRFERERAADLAAALRRLGLAGRVVQTRISPELERRHVRAARTRDARLRRETSVGFGRPGVQVDAEGRYSLTPEALAFDLGREVAGLRVVDTCCGVGGNAIGFARAGCSVVAIERDPGRLAMARHNAGIYGVADKIEFRAGDAVHMLSELDADLLFVDPPWGRDWDRERTQLADVPLLERLLAQREGRRLWAKLPASFDVSQLPGARPRAVFGAAAGDARRIKFLLLSLGD